MYIKIEDNVITTILPYSEKPDYIYYDSDLEFNYAIERLRFLEIRDNKVCVVKDHKDIVGNFALTFKEGHVTAHTEVPMVPLDAMLCQVDTKGLTFEEVRKRVMYTPNKVYFTTQDNLFSVEVLDDGGFDYEIINGT